MISGVFFSAFSRRCLGLVVLLFDNFIPDIGDALRKCVGSHEPAVRGFGVALRSRDGSSSSLVARRGKAIGIIVRIDNDASLRRWLSKTFKAFTKFLDVFSSPCFGLKSLAKI